jgi:hypothetical protein
MFGNDEQNNNNGGTSLPSEPAPDGTLTTAMPDASAAQSTVASIDSMGSNNSPVNQPTPSADVTSDSLLTIKQQALQQLTPLISHLNQTPEEKFRTTMMMIQGSDNKSLIKDAYEAAQQISDDKARAEALLDVVNEINYFTQHPLGEV